MARRRAQVDADPHDLIVGEYRERLALPAVLPWAESSWKPKLLGPTWRVGSDGRWVLPERSLGWDALGWCGRWLKHPAGSSWRFTDEQARFLLWWYAIDADGRFLFRDGVLQRLKGWGKDPLGACLCAIEALGPCRFAGWDDDGAPLPVDVDEAWIQLPAVSLEQTKNTMRLFPSLFTDEARDVYGLQIGKEVIHALDDRRLIQAVTSSPTTLEGARATFVMPNETHHWTSSNAGHDMADVIERNATKAPDAGARTLRITNAFEPGEDSIAERDRVAYEKAQAGTVADTGLLYDSLEADPKAPLDAEHAPSVVESIRGDSVWLDTERIVQSILDIRNPPSRSRRFWYNQITATEDAWVTPAEYDACAQDGVGVVIPDGETITLGFDGSETDDHTALIACAVELDHYWPLGIWVPPEGGRIDTADVDLTVRQAFERFDVVGFYGDVYPWESYHDRWSEDFGEDLIVRASRQSATKWDMRGDKERTTRMIENLQAAIVATQITFDGSSAMAQHFYNARRAPNRWGVTVRKESRESSRKIDSVPATALARKARLDYVALPAAKRRRKKKSGKVW